MRVRADHLPIEFGVGIEVVVVVIQTGFFQFFGLAVLQHAQRDAGFHAQRFDFADHVRDDFQFLLFRAAPGRAHAETGGTGCLGLFRRFQHLFDFHQRLALGGLVTR